MVQALAIAVNVLKKPIDDLYNLGKGKFTSKLNSLQNENNLKQLAKKVYLHNKVRTIWQKSKDVKISEMYYSPQIIFSEEVTRNVDSLSKIHRTQNYVVEGTVGQGKSIFLRYLCIQELSTNGTGRIPIFLELRTIEKYSSLESAIKNALSNLGFEIDKDLYEFYLESGHIVLLLDGFDELPSNHVMSVTEELETLSLKFTNLQIIVSSRPDRDIQKSVRFNILKIAPLSKRDFEPFLTKIKVPPALRKQLLEALNNKASKVSELLTTPLMLTLVAYVYRSEREIPAELPQFFEILFQTVFTAHDKTKISFTRECKSGLDETSLQRLFEAFCFMALQSGKTRTLKQSDFESSYTKAIQYCKNTSKLSEFKHDIVQVACLMQVEGFDTTFIHQSVQEYYAASFIKNCITEAAEKFYNSVKVFDRFKWLQILSFLKLIDEYRWAKYFRVPILQEAKRILNGGTNFENTKKILEECEFSINITGENTARFNAFYTGSYQNEIIRKLVEMIGMMVVNYTNDKEEFVFSRLKESKISPKMFSEDSNVVSLSSLIADDLIKDVEKVIQDCIKACDIEINALGKIIQLEESKISIF
jgi:hypothetical protein